MENNYKFGSIIPLIGGFTIAGMNVFEKEPEFIVSYPNFSRNDGILLKNYPSLQNKYYVMEDSPDFNFVDNVDILNKLMNVDIDIMIGVPICGGLSQLNTCTNKDSDMCRGADAAQNRFMRYTTEFVLEKVQPKVYIFENAPNLYTTIGKPVRDDLIEIAKKYGYSITFYKTCTNLHGIPQKRSRTYTFCWKSKTAPIVNFYNKEVKDLKDYLAEIPETASMHDLEEAKEKYINDPFIQYILNEGPGNIEEIKPYKTILNYICQKEGDEYPLIDKTASYFRKNGNEKLATKMEYIKGKLLDGKGFWDFSPLLYDKETNAIISKNMFRSVHPDGNRFLTKREYMYLMGLPHTFEIKETEVFTITQNVPVATSEDMIKEGIKFIEGKLEYSGSEVVMQNNTNKTIEYERKVSKNNFMDLLGG